MHYFYVPFISNGILPEEESLHAAKVLRLQTGELITLLDGKGGVALAKITLPHPKKCAFEVVNHEHKGSGRNYRLHVAIAPTKNIERFEWFIEKAIEIGVDEITPVLCRYSERKHVKAERLDKLCVAACKQSVQTVFPTINEMTDLHPFLKTAKAFKKCIAHCYPQERFDFRRSAEGQNDLLILIGPEGDFSLEEVILAIEQGFEPVSLGSSRLRTETAGVMACATATLCAAGK
jgi:16S rRNA (uracil1498-N3)-methyltransferase